MILMNTVVSIFLLSNCCSRNKLSNWKIILRLPQTVIVIIVPRLNGARSLNTKNLLKIVVILQYIPRVLRIRPLYKEVTRSSGILTETAWAGAALNLFLYMLASHVSIHRKFYV